MRPQEVVWWSGGTTPSLTMMFRVRALGAEFPLVGSALSPKWDFPTQIQINRVPKRYQILRGKQKKRKRKTKPNQKKVRVQ